MREKLGFLKTNKKLNRVLQVLATIGVFVFPMLVAFSEDELMPLNYLWIAVYSCIFACVVYKEKWKKVCVCCMNALCTSLIWPAFIVGLLMGGIEVIYGLLWSAFVTNPWF